MSEYIEVGQPLQFTDPNTPTRVGEIVENVSDIYNITSPRLGMQVFVKSERKCFVITSLKSKVIGGVDVPEAAVEAFEPVGVKSITWNNDNDPSNMNDFVVAGVYDIKGEHTRENDNLPILNTGGGHSFNARLTVLDSSISGSGNNDDKCITQVLSFSNRLGQGEVYIRTGKGSSLDNLTWEKWSTLQRNVNVGEVGSLDDLKDNGIYSGVWLQGHYNSYPLTFVCVVINDYFIGIAPRRVSQFVYGLSKDGSVVYQSRVWDDSKDKWSGWEILNKNEISSMISAEIKNVTDGIDPDKIDSIKDIVAWIDAHGGDVTAIYTAIQENTTKITEEARRATVAEENIRKNAIKIDASGLQIIDNELQFVKVNLDNSLHLVDSVPAATTEKAGIMSAVDKRNLDSIPNEIEKIKDGDTIVGQAREIHSRNGKTVTDSFLARTTAGSGTVGDGVATLKSVGGNIVKNLVDGFSNISYNGDSIDYYNVNSNVVYFKTKNNASYGGLYVKLKTFIGHTYYISASVKDDGNTEALIQFSGLAESSAVTSKSAKWELTSKVFSTTSATHTFNMFIRTPDKLSHSAEYTKPLVIDLTEMFGAGNEPDKATCDKLFGTMDALPQGLTVANPNEFKSTGFNQFNPENVLDGKAITNNAIESGDKKIAIIPCLPCKIGVGENNGYCIHGEFGEDINVYLTPLNPMDVDGELYMHELTKDATTDTYVPLIKGYMLVEVPTTANLCAHFLWSEDKCERDTYEPYFESKVELPVIPQMSEWGLAGIYSNGTPVCDEIDFARGVYIKRIGAVDMGSVRWSRVRYGFYSGDIKPKMSNGTNVLCAKYTTFEPKILYNNSAIAGVSGPLQNYWGFAFIQDEKYADVDSLKASLQGVMLYYELNEPIEYPLPKIDNSYISSDYGVEQFNSVVPCNANNLYYMRSLAGETRNFLDRLYDNTDKTDAKEVADYITNGIESNKKLATNAPNLALRALYVAAGAVYNTDTGYYELNGVTDLTEEDMAYIYDQKEYVKSLNIARYFQGDKNLRTIYPINVDYLAFGINKISPTLPYYDCNIEVLKFFKKQTLDQTTGMFMGSGTMSSVFTGARKLKTIYPINVSDVTNTGNSFDKTFELVDVRLIGLKCNVSFKDSAKLSKESVLYIIQNAAKTTDITITLHADAYARLEEDADIVAALAAQPLVTLVSA